MAKQDDENSRITKLLLKTADVLESTEELLAYLMAFRIDCNHEPIFKEMANAATMRGAAHIPNLKGGFDEVDAPLWMGRYYVHGQSGARTPVTDNVLNKDWTEFAQERLSVNGVQYHALRHTHQDAVTQLGMLFKDRLVSSNWDKSVMEDFYTNQGRNHDVTFPDAGWPAPWQRTHIMGRSDFTAEWFQAEPWRSRDSWQQWEHLSPWQPAWAKFTGIWEIVERKLMPGDGEVVKQYTDSPPDEKVVGPVMRFLALIPWWREVVLQDAPLRLRFEPDTTFFQKHRLFKDPVFHAFFNSILCPVVVAAHDDGELRCQQQRDFDPHQAQEATRKKMDRMEDAISKFPEQITQAVLAATAQAGSKRSAEAAGVAPEVSAPPAPKRPQMQAPSLPAVRGYARAHKPLLTWATPDTGGKTAGHHIAQLVTFWEHWDETIRPFLLPTGCLDTAKAGWERQQMHTNYSRDKFLFMEVAERGRDKEQAVLGVLKTMFHKHKWVSKLFCYCIHLQAYNPEAYNSVCFVDLV